MVKIITTATTARQRVVRKVASTEYLKCTCGRAIKKIEPSRGYVKKKENTPKR